MKIDTTKPVKTRDGRPVTLISDQGRDGRPLVGFIGSDTVLNTWAADGRFRLSAGTPSLLDLVQELEVWVNVYSNGFGVFPAKEQAEQSSFTPIARIRVPYTPGQFD